MLVPSRREDPTPVKCLDCGWEGRQMDCFHTYQGYGYGEEADVEPVDRCPNCGGYEPEPITSIIGVLALPATVGG